VSRCVVGARGWPGRGVPRRPQCDEVVLFELGVGHGRLAVGDFLLLLELVGVGGGGRTVFVQPLTQIVDRIVAGVTSGLRGAAGVRATAHDLARRGRGSCSGRSESRDGAGMAARQQQGQQGEDVS
jgi:hypothetical protein